MANEAIKEEILEVEEIEKDQYLAFTSKSQEFGIQAMRVHEISAPLGHYKDSQHARAHRRHHEPSRTSGVGR